MFFRRSHIDDSNGLPFFFAGTFDRNSPSRFAAHFLLTVALLLTGLGILVLLFPLVLAVFVAILFFMVAAACLRFAWHFYRITRSTGVSPPVDHEIHVVEHHDIF